MTLCIMASSIMDLIGTLSKETEGIVTLRIMTQSVMTISIMDLIVALSKKESIILLSKMKPIVIQHNGHDCKTQPKQNRENNDVKQNGTQHYASQHKVQLVTLSKKQRE